MKFSLVKAGVIVSFLCSCSSNTITDIDKRSALYLAQLEGNEETYHAEIKLDKLNVSLEQLSRAGAKTCLPGRFKKLEKDIRHVTRELKSDLIADSLNHMSQIEWDSQKVGCVLSIVKRNTTCSEPDTNNYPGHLPQTQWGSYLDFYSLFESPNCEFIDITLIEETKEKPEIIKVPEKSAKREVQVNLLMDILFDNDSDKINEFEYGKLVNLAETMNGETELVVKLRGHTDFSGDEEYNFELSKRRIMAVVNLLKQQGVSSKRISSIPLGESAPRTNKPTREARQINRRVEVFLLTQNYRISKAIADISLIKNSGKTTGKINNEK